MTTIVKELRDALVEAGASPEKADAAAQAVIAHEQAATKSDLILTEAGLKQEIGLLRTELYKALLLHAGVVVGLTVTLLKLLP